MSERVKRFVVRIVPTVPNGVREYAVDIAAESRVIAQNVALARIGKKTPCRLADSERYRT